MGGTVYFEEEFPNLFFAKDGEIYDLEGIKAIAIGGAYSVDKWYRLQRNIHWFPDEQPSVEIKTRVEKKLDDLGWQIDAVLTHTCPYGYIPREAFMSCVDQSTVDNSTELWLDTLEKKLNYKAWYCGHWHIEKRIDKIHFLFESVETVSSTRRNSAESATSRMTDARTLSKEQLDVELEKGYNDIKAGNTVSVEQVFNRIRKE